ncbi:MAG TPA: hypothetical protein V6D50_00950 [Chroococcales cyanobacterium]
MKEQYDRSPNQRSRFFDASSYCEAGNAIAVPTSTFRLTAVYENVL